ncbi:MAG: hypothetical protein ACOC56_03245 [Atribacterota bacterium]
MSEEKQDKKVECYFRDCRKIWTYRGKNPFYATCPKCQRKISFNKLNKLKSKGEI